MLSPADVTREPDFSIGWLRVSPSARTVTVGDETISLEPRVMQVLLLLARQPNQVVTREALFTEVWGGVMVGDDSLNRAVAGVRRVVALDPSSLTLDTIPRTGYRLSVADGGQSDNNDKGTAPITRRLVIGGGVAIAGVAGLGLWARRATTDREFDDLMARSKEALLYGDPAVSPTDFLEKAVKLRPYDAEAQGMLAYSLALQSGNVARLSESLGRRSGNSMYAANVAAQKALMLDPKQPFARLSQSFTHHTTMDLSATEALFQSIGAAAPANVEVMKNYWNLLQCVGRSAEALAVVQKALVIEPMAASVHYPLAQLLWITGQTPEADRVIDQAMRYWPKHWGVRFARFIILAFTGRPRIALSMLENPDLVPQGFTAKGVALWRTSLKALDHGSPSAITTAKKDNLEWARSDLTLTNQAVMVLSTLGDLDGAFELTNALFAVPKTASFGTVSQRPASSANWRFAPWLFIPPIAPMRDDPRFATLCDTVGLTAYWKKRGVRPDYQTA